MPSRPPVQSRRMKSSCTIGSRTCRAREASEVITAMPSAVIEISSLKNETGSFSQDKPSTLGAMLTQPDAPDQLELTAQSYVTSAGSGLVGSVGLTTSVSDRVA